MNKIIIPKGLTQDQVEVRRQKFGLNELTPKPDFFQWISKFYVLKEPMILLLIFATVTYFLIGDFEEGVLLAFSVCVAVSLTLYQEHKSEKALSSLKDLSSPRALVIREEKEFRIPAKELVPDDIIVLYEGDRVPADGQILESTNFSVDESLLTGESFSVKKDTSSKDFSIYASTLVVSGTAISKVTHTALETKVGNIGKMLNEEPEPETSLSLEIKSIVKLFAWICIIICSIIVAIYGISRNDWVQAILVGLATAMSLLPEEFPVVYTVFMALGAWRLSKVNVLIRKLNSIEKLGAITYLCVDKTGTLTKNQMCVSMLSNNENLINVENQNQLNLPESFHEVVECGILASHKDPFDPMEKAILKLAKDNAWGLDHLHDWELEKDYSLSSKLLAMSCVWKNTSDGKNYIVASKGAPEAVIDLCHLDKYKTEKILIQVKEMAKLGLRVLGVAKSKFPIEKLPEDQHSFVFEWVGLIGLSDPLRSEVPEAVKKCQHAGIRVMMMTGDYPETALQIAKKAGLMTTGGVITGQDIDTLTDEVLFQKMLSTQVFARMTPENKLRIVKLLKNKNEIVAMTGDGVNDAPSLKWASVGIAMGARGTDVAREASDMVITDDNFSSIVNGIERGRIIFRNIKTAMSYIVSIHVPIAGLAVIPVILNWPLILLPMHIVFLELIIDPACSILFESQKSSVNVMDEKPRSVEDRFFTANDFWKSFIQGGIVLLILTTSYYYFLEKSNGDDLYARTIIFSILVLSNLSLIFAKLSFGRVGRIFSLMNEKANMLMIIGVVSTLTLGLIIPICRSFFKLAEINMLDTLKIILFSVLIFGLLLISNYQKQDKI